MWLIAMISTSGRSPTVQGGGEYLFGPNHCTGDVRSLNTGSSKIRTPRDPDTVVLVSTRKDAWPIHVALNLSGTSSPQSGFRMGARPCRFAGTGTLFLPSVRRNRVEKTLEILTGCADDQGLRKAVGGFPTWCSGPFFAKGLAGAMSAMLISERMLLLLLPLELIVVHENLNWYPLVSHTMRLGRLL